MSNSIEIIEMNYFSDLNASEWNYKVTYTKNGKTYCGCFYNDSFNKKIFFPQKQQKGCKNLKGLHVAIIENFNKRGFIGY